MEELADTIGSAKPPKPSKSHDPERWKRLIPPVVAVATVAAATFAGITAWETHQDRVNSKAFYCAVVLDPGPDQSQKQLSDQLDC